MARKLSPPPITANGKLGGGGVRDAFTRVDHAMALLARIDFWLEGIWTFFNDRNRNALDEGVNAGSLVVPTTNAVPSANTGFSGPWVLQPNPKRRGCSFINTSAAGGPSITLGLGIGQPTPGQGIVLLAGGQSWDGRISGMRWRGAVSAVASGAGATLSYLEA